MTKYYAIATKTGKDKGTGENVATGTKFVIDNLPETRHGAVAAAERFARQNKMSVDGVYLVASKTDNGGLMSKGIRKQKRTAHAKQVAAYRKKMGRKALR